MLAGEDPGHVRSEISWEVLVSVNLTLACSIQYRMHRQLSRNAEPRTLNPT